MSMSIKYLYSAKSQRLNLTVFMNVFVLHYVRLYWRSSYSWYIRWNLNYIRTWIRALFITDWWCVRILDGHTCMLIINRSLSMLLYVLLYRYGPPTRTDYRIIVENLSSRCSWQVSHS